MCADRYSDRERVELFLERAEKLRNNSLIRLGRMKAVRFMSNYEEHKGAWFDLLGARNEPLNMESFEALVATFRLIYMKKEPTHIEKVYDAVVRSLPAAHYYEIEHFKENWQRALQESSHFAAGDGDFIPLDEVLNNWLYGEVFHSDKDKRKFVKVWGKHLEAEVVFIVNFLCRYNFWLEDYFRERIDERMFRFID